MGFDYQNFGIGLLTGWVTGYGVYRARHRIAALRRSLTQQAASAQNYATQSADSRYIADLAELAEAGHLAGRFVKLSRIVVEPRFLPAPPLAAPPDEEAVPGVFQSVPLVHDFPYVYAPYNLETMSVDDLGSGERALALLGRPGSGRTTALLTIALRSLGRVDFEVPMDKVQQRIDAEDAALTDKQRAVRVKERLAIEQRARERLAQEHGITFEAADAAGAVVPTFNRLMPVYIHLADIVPNDAEFGKQVDPAEPLVRAVQRQVGRITASSIPRNLYKRLNAGQVLLLVDGYDDLPEADRGQPLAWLQALISNYSQNFFIVVGPVCGHGPLLRLGLTPVYLRPWMDLDVSRAAERWAEAWPEIVKKQAKGAAAVAEDAISRAKTNSRALSPFDLTLKIWGNYAGDTEIPGMEGWLRSLLNRFLPAKQALESILPQLSQMGALQLDEGYITLPRLETVLVGQSLVALSEADEPGKTETGEGGKAGKGKGDKKEDTSAQAKFLTLLYRSGLLVRYFGGRYQFRHPFVAAYLASLTLKEAEAATLAEKALNPAWNQAFAFAALHMPVDEAVRARLNSTPDILHNHVLEIAYWLAYAPSTVSWRSSFLKHLGSLFVAPAQYPLLRERVVAALVTTRDKNILPLLRQTVRSDSLKLRQLSIIALGTVGAPETVDDICPLLHDERNDIQLAAGLALGAIGTETALEALVEVLTEGSEQLRQAVAETLAAIPDEGYPILYDAVQDKDMMLRRAAVFGLRRIRAAWALTALYRTFLEDEQWYVRSAAQLAFQSQEQNQDKGPHGYPPVDSLPWLAAWAAQRGENVPPGEAANQMLLRTLQEGEPDIRVLSAAIIGQLGLVATAKPLYTVLRDRNSELRDAAHRALAGLEMQMGQPLPAPL